MHSISLSQWSRLEIIILYQILQGKAACSPGMFLLLWLHTATNKYRVTEEVSRKLQCSHRKLHYFWQIKKSFHHKEDVRPIEFLSHLKRLQHSCACRNGEASEIFGCFSSQCMGFININYEVILYLKKERSSSVLLVVGWFFGFWDFLIAG